MLPITKRYVPILRFFARNRPLKVRFIASVDNSVRTGTNQQDKDDTVHDKKSPEAQSTSNATKGKIQPDEDSRINKNAIRADHKLVLSKLAFDLEESEVKKAFEPIGGVVSVSIARNPKTGKSRGYGTMIFQTAELAKRASIEMQGLVLHNKPIITRVKSEMRYEGIKSKKYDILHIKNLPYEMTNEDLLKLFAPYEALRSGIAKAPITRKNLGYGYVRFSSANSAYRALLKTRDLKFHDRRLKIAFAEPKPHNYRFIV
ncbi:hypothetical protein BRETT_000303 [Brettanomyces bruxellensis]|uniref:RRM domain-containing protein n=1 Tax=Dekkera bruxellensis TaxID=5007 RepID=A0A871R2E5_DEKBR|nr:uncharacterized protein BRETT_000303 [Brettanomyces bruxellensis]QOU20593.1 hypothetical protein BRETT_000303 [Brettanomyces bruxellensis]